MNRVLKCYLVIITFEKSLELLVFFFFWNKGWFELAHFSSINKIVVSLTEHEMWSLTRKY